MPDSDGAMTLSHLYILFIVPQKLEFGFHCGIFVGLRLMMLMDVEPENEKIYFNLGMLSMDDMKFEEARAWFDRAIEVLSVQFAIFVQYPRESFCEGLCFYRRWFVCLSVRLFVTTITK